jgi:hypothetical protein
MLQLSRYGGAVCTSYFVSESNLLDGARLNNIYEFSPYLKENTTLHRYKDQLFNPLKLKLV